MELRFLGTSAGVPSLHHNVSGLLLGFGNKRQMWLFDCGEGTQHQMLKAGVTLTSIEKIFITHLHGDHLFGLPGLLSSRSMQQNASALTIYGPVGIKQYVEVNLALSCSYLTYPIDVVELTEGRIFANKEVTVDTLPLMHRIPSYGFRVTKSGKREKGRLNVELLMQQGIKPGPDYALLQRGERVTLSDGTVIDGLDYLLPDYPDKTVAIMGDTEPCDNIITLAKAANCLVHEATLSYQLKDKAYANGHSTPVDAAQVAKQAGVRQLIISHISSRYGEIERHALLDEARDIFQEVKLAEELGRFTVY